jgi:hypothetical protein
VTSNWIRAFACLVGLLCVAGCGEARSTNVQASLNPVQVVGGVLESPVTYDKGIKRFDPISPNSPPPPVDEKQATSAFEKTGVDAKVIQNVAVQTFLSEYTDFGQSATLDGKELKYDHRLSWVIRYPNAITGDVGMGAPGTEGASPSKQVAVPHDVVAIVDAESGVCLEILNDVPDPSALANPIATASPTAKP